jgi:hypothetical protein
MNPEIFNEKNKKTVISANKNKKESQLGDSNPQPSEG